MKIRSAIFVICLLVSFCKVKGDTIYTKSDVLIFEKYIEQLSDKAEEPFSELIPNTAKFFLGSPYVASTLEIGDTENLVVNLREFDCTTLVENSIALSGMIKSRDFSFSSYCRFLQMLRYRDREVEGYTSRLHYLGDWIYENEDRKVLQNITADLGGVKKAKPVNYMSTHPQSYKHLKNNTENTKKIKAIEDEINNRNNYIIIPKASIPGIEKDIKDGDIIAFATTIGGLDYSHVGIAYRVDGQLRFIHASSAAKKVIVDKRSLSEYCNNSRTCSGISVLRVRD